MTFIFEVLKTPGFKKMRVEGGNLERFGYEGSPYLPTRTGKR